ncbi:RNA polymerase subunit sigma-24 [Sutcliffiella horikoshii]|uniref:RNA polymerase subunit sigma-24 n=1 Tax=Sutcliffiella horikoshii TaxID=79883 RepID=A0ABN4ZHC0_9BACI|nr:RNA polymerase sigma factor [Sutcliffiella horikoshii]ART77843.1 RNA polymerase subunit sigma-24 [Sutcliffiella horikoshii]
MISDERLLEQMAEGDQAAFEAFVHRYHVPIHQYTERLLKDSKKAEDVVQETFIRLLKQLKSKQIPTYPKAWLYRVASNICKDYWRSAQYRSEDTAKEEMPVTVDQQASVIEIYERQETRKEMLASLKNLSESQQQIVTLRFYQDMKLKEIADILDLPLGTVKSNLFHALKKLKGVLSKEVEKEAANNEGTTQSRPRAVSTRR